MLLKFSDKFVIDNLSHIAETILEKAAGDNIGHVEGNKRVYEELLNVTTRKIDRVEKRLNTKSSCRKGCAHCCYQIIHTTDIEADFIMQEIMKMAEDDMLRIKKQTSHNLELLKKTNIPKRLKKNDEKAINLEYLKLRLRCPLLPFFCFIFMLIFS